MELIDGPWVERWEARPTIGLRRRVPFRGMLAERDRLLAQLFDLLDRDGIEPDGPFFLRLRTVDMAGQMNVEVGAFASVDENREDLLTISEAAAGEYAVLTYRDHSIRANRHLHEWVTANGVVLDAQPSSDGDEWAGRFEIYLTDPRTEPRKTRWTTQLAFLTR
jgi:hypothetical protein